MNLDQTPDEDYWLSLLDYVESISDYDFSDDHYDDIDIEDYLEIFDRSEDLV